MSYPSEEHPHLATKPVSVAPDTLLQTPLSRRGEGPGLLLLVPRDYQGRSSVDLNKTLDPEPLQKWAEEGFAVAEVRVGDGNDAVENCQEAIKALINLPQCTSSEKVGVIVYDSKLAPAKSKLWTYFAESQQIAGIVLFAEDEVEVLPWTPLLLHSLNAVSKTLYPDPVYKYDSVSSVNFILPGHQHYQPGPAGVAHTRTLGFLRKHLDGPYFDLEAIWDEHCGFEFDTRNVEKTMGTMVEEPYVNHIPTLTGGIGRKALTAFYRDHFIFNNPEDTALELISRTVGTDRVIDEFIFCFTHDKMIDWLIPGIPPTHRSVRIPFTSVVNVRGDRLYHEHIAWDQASVLRQLGLLPEYLPFPYPLPDGRTPEKGKRFEYRVPVEGVDTARKLVDENAVVSNGMLGFEVREVDDV